MRHTANATGVHASGKPFLRLTPVVDHDMPDTMNQIVWSLMYLLEQRGISGVDFDMDNVNSYNKIFQAIGGMISDAALPLATLAEHRAGTITDKATTPQGITAVCGNYSVYRPVSTSPVSINGSSDMGSLIICTGSASVLNLPLITSVPRVGVAFTVINLKTSGNITINRAGSNTLTGVAGSTTSVVLAPGQWVTIACISTTIWAVIGSILSDIASALTLLDSRADALDADVSALDAQVATLDARADSLDTQVAVLDARLDAIPLQKKWTGAWTTYQSKPGTGFSTSLYAFAHNLLVLPEQAWMEIQCVGPEGNYLAGETFDIPLHQAAEKTGADVGISYKKTTTHIHLAFDTNHGMLLHQWNADPNFSPSNNLWKFRLKAWA